MSISIRPVEPIRPIHGSDDDESRPGAVSRDENRVNAPGTRPSSENAEKLAERLTERAMRSHARLEISKDEDAGEFVYRTVDERSGEVLRQYPREEVLRMRTYLRELEGRLVDRKV